MGNLGSSSDDGLAVQDMDACMLSLTLCDPMDYSPPGFSAHGDSSGKYTGVGCCALLQGIFPDSVIEPTSPVAPASQADTSPLSHQEAPQSPEANVNKAASLPAT